MAGGGAITTIDSGIIEYAIFIVLLPMLAFPIILFLGHIINGNQTWVKSAKEGGLIALPIMVASFVLSILLIVEYIGASQGEFSIGTFFENKKNQSATKYSKQRSYNVPPELFKMV